MKKYILLVLLFFIPFVIKAQTCDIENITIEEVVLEEKFGEAEEKSTPVIDGMNISFDLKFKEVGDFIKYKITIKNDTDDVYNFSKKNLVTNSNFISYTFENDSFINAHETKDIYLTVKYKAKVTSFDNGIFNEIKSVKNALNFEELVNPETGVFDLRIIVYVVLAISTITYLISKHKVNNSYYIILLVIGLIIPVSIYSACVCEIKVNSTVEIEEFNDRKVYNIIGDESKLDSIKSKYVSASNGVDFSEPSSDTNGKGQYIFASTKDDEYPVYYYRGDVSDNNVLFGGHCWKILRTTSTGGTKLVYNGLPDSENKCNNTGTDTMLATGVRFNASSNTKYFGYAYDSGHAYAAGNMNNIANGTPFANDVTYENGEYVLSDDVYLKDDSLLTNVEELLHNHHYICVYDSQNKCTKVNYYYMHRDGTVYLYYVTLTNGDKIEDLIEKDLTNSANVTDSTIKTRVETWFGDNLTSYSNYLEDEVYCNDRSIGSIGGWNKNGNLVELKINGMYDDVNKLQLSPYKRAKEGKPSLACVNESDRFTTSTTNGNGKNIYPIGLITLDEAMLAGFAWDKQDYSSYLYNGGIWWTMSPTLNSVAYDYIGVLHSMADNVYTTYTSNGSGGVRPVVTLNKNVKINGGNGTGDNPFTVTLD